MNNITKYLFLLLSICMGACSTDNVENENLFKEDNEITKIIAVSPQLDWDKIDSRTVITMGDYPNGKIVWGEKDTIGIYPNSGDQLSFPIVEGVGTSECVFNGGGWALKADSTYTAYSPFNRSYYYKDKKELPISMLGQKQVGNNNSTHLGKYDIQAAKGNKPTNGSLTFALKRKVAFVRFDLTAPKAATWKSITLESDAHFPVEATMDLSKETPTLTTTSSSNSVTLELEDVNTNDSLHIVAYMAFLPVDITNKSLSIKLTNNEGNEYSSNAFVVNDRTNFEANGIRWITGEFNMVPSNQIWYTSIDGEIVTPTAASGGRVILSNEIIDGKGVITYDKDVTYIYQYEFSKCTNLKSVSLPNSVIGIFERAFENCSSIEKVNIPCKITEINDYTFSNCIALKTINLSNCKIVSIGRDAFSGCESMTEVIMNNHIKTIEANAFFGCKSLKNINLSNGLTTIETAVFAYCI